MNPVLAGPSLMSAVVDLAVMAGGATVVGMALFVACGLRRVVRRRSRRRWLARVRARQVPVAAGPAVDPVVLPVVRSRATARERVVWPARGAGDR